LRCSAGLVSIEDHRRNDCRFSILGSGGRHYNDKFYYKHNYCNNIFEAKILADLTRAEKLRAALQAEDSKRTPKSTGDNASFPFWTIPDNSNATIRFLPDADPNNLYFWADREVIKLRFAGQTGGEYATDQEVEVTVPCVDMFGDSCPIIAEIKPWWKQGPEKEALARLYYKKKSHIFQGFVVNSPLDEANVPVNPIRRFVINPSIFKIIRQALMDPQMEDVCTDYVGGRDFKIVKSKSGEYANYSTSTWSFRTRPLNEMETIAIQEYGLFNLADFKGPRPDADGIAMIKAMFHDSLAGRAFDFAAYGKTYRGYSNDRSSYGNTNAAAAMETVTLTPVGKKPAASAATLVQEGVNDVESGVRDTPTEPPMPDILDRIRKKTMAS
jgi:hypothetical protein